MKIKTVRMPYSEVRNLVPAKHKKPLKPDILFRTLMRVASGGDLKKADFSYTVADNVNLNDGPFLILMNHSSFIDLKIASRIMYPKPYGIVCTSDALVGKEWMMRKLGCIPTQKYVGDLMLLKDLKYALKNRKMSVLMYPEAGYTFDGTATLLPRKLGLLVRMLAVPVLMIRTDGAFLKDPLYNGLQLRKIKVSAEVTMLVSREEAVTLSNSEVEKRIDDAFTFDNFRKQFDSKTEITEPFRADGLERILYKCPVCGTELKTRGSGTRFTCSACNAEYEMDVYGRLVNKANPDDIRHIPDWYAWERECVKEEIINGTYSLNTHVDIGVLIDTKALYMIGGGTLTHSAGGFTLKSDDGTLDYFQSPVASYGLNSDFFWYEIGDVICIGDHKALYYCFTGSDVSVAKARLAQEEIYKLEKAPIRTRD